MSVNRFSVTLKLIVNKIRYLLTMPDILKEQEEQKQPKNEKESTDDNDINTCAGGLTDKQVKELQEELERAKEENSYSSSSRCTIT